MAVKSVWPFKIMWPFKSMRPFRSMWPFNSMRSVRIGKVAPRPRESTHSIEFLNEPAELRIPRPEATRPRGRPTIVSKPNSFTPWFGT